VVKVKKISKKEQASLIFKNLTIFFLIVIIGALIYIMYIDYKTECPSILLYLINIIFAMLLLIFIIATVENIKETVKGKAKDKKKADILKKIKKEKEIILKKKKKEDNDIKELLKIIDEVLAKLPDKEKEELVYSKDFEFYKSILKKYKIK